MIDRLVLSDAWPRGYFPRLGSPVETLNYAGEFARDFDGSGQFGTQVHFVAAFRLFALCFLCGILYD